MRRIAIEEFLTESKNALVIDVRSPSEYHHAHIPGAINLPLFTDEERAVVGTTYKQVSRQAAIKTGLDYFGPRMREIVEEIERQISNRQLAIDRKENCQLPVADSVFVYCWRGGMRSGAVAWLLNLYGFNVTVLAGGYKAFRNWVLQTTAYPYRLRLVGGYTGSGKTAILKRLEQGGESVINLEELARHKGSAFGNIGMPSQPSQEMFENLLSYELQALSRQQNDPSLNIWIEDESQRIGHINLPPAFWLNMRQSPVYFLDIPFEERLQNLVSEYGNLDKEKMISAIQRITKRLGGLEAGNAIQFLEGGNTIDCFRILLRYYDKQYLKALHNREHLSAVLTKIPCERVTEENAALLSQLQAVS